MISPAGHRSAARSTQPVLYGVSLLLALMAFPVSLSLARELPEVHGRVNDAAGLLPSDMVRGLDVRLTHVEQETGHRIVVVTIHSLEGVDLKTTANRVLDRWKAGEKNLNKAVILLAAKDERKLGITVTADLEDLFPEPRTTEMMQFANSYLAGYKPEFGIKMTVDNIIKVITGQISLNSPARQNEPDRALKALEVATAIFAFFLSPLLAFIAGFFWSIFSTKNTIPTASRVALGGFIGFFTASLVASFWGAIGRFSFNLWFFMSFLGFALGALGSVREFWDSGEWSGQRNREGEQPRQSYIGDSW